MWEFISTNSTTITTVAAMLNIAVLAISAMLVYRQIKIASQSFSLKGMLEVQRVFQEISELSVQLYQNFPPELVLTIEKFPARPPSRHKLYRISDAERRRMALSPEQIAAREKLSENQKRVARKLIGKLNDVGQYAENGWVDYDAVLSKYHTIIIRLCSIIEPIRQMIESEMKDSIGGNYGHRLLRMRHKAVLYNQIHPKHRSVDIKIFVNGESIVVLPAVPDTPFNRIYCFFQRIHYRRV